jgi:hypothetical protein
MENSKNRIDIKKLTIFLILTAIIASKVININYNSPFNDEAIYIVVGKQLLTNFNISYFDAFSWMSGFPYLYPPVSGLLYMLGGISLSRIFNVFVLGVYAYVTFKITQSLNKKGSFFTGIISTILIGFSVTGYYVARLATYDLPSYLFLLLSFYPLLTIEKCKKDEEVKGKYLNSALLLIFGSALKYTVAIYAPILLLVGYLKLKQTKKDIRNIRHFVYPIILTGVVFGLFQLPSLLTFFTEEVVQVEKFFVSDILSIIFDQTKYILPFYIIGSFGLLNRKDWKKLLLINLSGLWIILFHIFTKRVLTIEKHIMISVTFLSVISDIGISNLIDSFKNRFLKWILYLFATIALVFYIFLSYQKSQEYNEYWVNTNDAETYLSENVKGKEIILTELGDSTTLALQDKLNLNNIITFDWFVYDNKEGEPAYITALEDNYFNYIILVSDTILKDSLHQSVHKIIIENINDNYEIIYDAGNITIYKRGYSNLL